LLNGFLKLKPDHNTINDEGGLGQSDGVKSNDITGKCSEQGLSKLFIARCRLFGIFITNMSIISGRFLVKVYHYVGLVKIKLCI